MNLIRKKDLVIVILLLLILIILLAFKLTNKENSEVVSIISDDKLYGTYNLNEDRTINIKSKYGILKIKKLILVKLTVLIIYVLKKVKLKIIMK